MVYKLKFGMTEYTVGTLLHAKFFLLVTRWWVQKTPKIQNLVKRAVFWHYSRSKMMFGREGHTISALLHA